MIEDAAQAFGVKHNDRSIFSEAFISTLSFYPSKVLGGSSDGGAILTNNNELADRCRSLANHGRNSHYSYSEIGWNSRMSSLQGTFLQHAIARINTNIESRRFALNTYENFFAKSKNSYTLHVVIRTP